MRLFRFLKKEREHETNIRSVVFYRHSYYHFFYLAKALRDRGWDAIVVNLEPVDGASKNYFHGEDLNLYDQNPVVFDENITQFIAEASSRFKLMHFAGDGYMSFYPKNIINPKPPDIIAWKKMGHKVAYTVSGCNSGTLKSSVANWSIKGGDKSVCDRCIWQDRPEVCSEAVSLSWGKQVHRYCDLIFSETLPALDYMRSGKKLIREPATMCLDPEVWFPHLVIPSEHRIEKNPDEILIYHAVGNYDTRNSETRNIKGTPFIFQAVEQLKKEGHPVRLVFYTNKPNLEIRYYQAQADIIVDQLNYGRYGATAREGMMLGKPVICYMNQFEYKTRDKLVSLQECPLVSASEETIYTVLKKLVLDKELCSQIGKLGREYAVKWHSAAACAERYEACYDSLFS